MTPLKYKQSDTYFYFYPFCVDEISIAIRVGNEEIPECITTRFYDSCLIGIEDKAIAALGSIGGRIFGRNGKYDADNIRMKLYKLIKMAKTDNTDAPNSCKMKTSERSRKI